jgi:hypothetical protein
MTHYFPVSNNFRYNHLVNVTMLICYMTAIAKGRCQEICREIRISPYNWRGVGMATKRTFEPFTSLHY